MGTSLSWPKAPSMRCPIVTAGPGHRARGTPLSEGAASNELFELANGRHCYPLAVADHASRFLLLYEELDSTRGDTSCTAFLLVAYARDFYELAILGPAPIGSEALKAHRRVLGHPRSQRRAAPSHPATEKPAARR